jgi:hypothetical protein
MSRLLLTLLCLVALVAAASAAPFVVDRTDDDASAIGCADATNNDCSLRGAIIKANAAAGSDIIIVPAGTYNLTLLGAAEDNGATGDLDVRDDLSLTGAGAATTIIDASQLDDGVHPPDRALQIDPTGSGTLSVVINNLTIQKGKTEVTASVNPAGAGILNGGSTIASPLGSTVTLTRVVVKDSVTPRQGGGIANFGPMTITESVIDHNGAELGGGVFQGDVGSLSIEDTTVRSNDADSGGGLYSGVFSTDLDSPSAIVTRSTFRDNTSHGGGAIAANRGKVTVVNSTLSHNTSDGAGAGGIHNASANVFVRNSTLTLNEGASAGGGLSGTATLGNTILAGNTASTGPDCNGSITSAGYNLIQSTASCAVTPDPTTLTGVSPDLASLANNGGKTETHRLIDGSPAIDHASPAVPVLGGGGGACEDVDQRGVVRPVGPRCDIGAFEGGSPQPTTTTVTTTTTTSTSTTTHTPTTTIQGVTTTTQTTATTLPASSATTTRPPVTTTTLPLGDEVCGNCVDDDGDGLTDFEDPACCAGGQTAIALRKGKIRRLAGGASFLNLDTTIGAPGGIDALSQDVHVQLRTLGGTGLLCLNVPATKFRTVRRVVTFRDRKHTVPTAQQMDGVELRRLRGGALLVHLEGRRMPFATPSEKQLVLTLGFRNPTLAEGENRCASGTQTFRSRRSSGLLFP